MLICDLRAMHDLGLRIKAGTLTFRQPSEKGEPLKCLKEGEKALLSPFDMMASSLPGFSGWAQAGKPLKWKKSKDDLFPLSLLLLFILQLESTR